MNKTIHGLKEGKWIEYDTDEMYPNDVPSYSLTIYLNDKPHGLIHCYYKSGKPYYTLFYKNGKANGMSKEYYEDGTLSRETTYLNGKIVGIDRSYSPNGKLSLETPYVSDTIEGSQNWYDNGILSVQVLYRKGFKEGLVKKYTENGSYIGDSIDVASRVKYWLIGTWADIAWPTHIWIVSKDTIKADNNCWRDYFIQLENSPKTEMKGKYWFGIGYRRCGDTISDGHEYFGGISIDSTYMRFHVLESETDTNIIASETFVFKKE